MQGCAYKGPALLQSTSFPRVIYPRERLKNRREMISLGYFVGKEP